jgi:hypothetical protein
MNMDRFVHPPELDTLYQLLEEVGDGSPSESEMATILAALATNFPGTISLLGHYKVFDDTRISTAINELVIDDLGAFIQLIDVPGLENKDPYLVTVLSNLKKWPICAITITDKPMYSNPLIAEKVNNIVEGNEMLSEVLQNKRSTPPAPISDPMEPPMPPGGWGPAPPQH